MSRSGWSVHDPNSQNQLWSGWTFTITTHKRLPFENVRFNAIRWLSDGFGSVGEAKVTESFKNRLFEVKIEAHVEGVPANDPGYVESVRHGFRDFVNKGWGRLAATDMDVKLLAGDPQDGKPRAQLVVLPTIRLDEGAGI